MGLSLSRVDEMLDLVSLDRTEAKRRLRNYSLGMKQRLGIAHALLGDPSVLILDEPANGLDPAGIRWMRGLLKGYADRGGTVFLSSHLLNEVEQIADEMILIGRGKIVASGTKDELWPMPSTRPRWSPRSTTSCSPRRSRTRGSASPAGTGLRVDAAPVDVGRVAAEQSIVLTDLRSAEGGLEDLFLSLTADTQRDAVVPRGEGAHAWRHHCPCPHARHQRDRARALLAPGEGRGPQDGRHPRWLLVAARDRLLLVITVAIVLLVVGLNDDVTASAYDWSQILIIRCPCCSRSLRSSA